MVLSCVIFEDGTKYSAPGTKEHHGHPYLLVG
jgi:hypothetical protein